MSNAAGLDAKLLYRRLDSLFGKLEAGGPARRVLEVFLDDAFRTLRDDLALRAAALYAERSDRFALVAQAGEPGGVLADALPLRAPALTLTLEHSVYIFPEGADVGTGVFPPAAMAALTLGRRPSRYVIFLMLRDGWNRDELDFVLNTLRAALGARLQDERVLGKVAEAAEIQQSLLLDEPPAFSGFELACRSLAAEEVGGDFYDFLPLGPELLGLAIGDASGHGLPAALLVRDVVTGLRMGIEKDLKVTYVFGKLNRVIHRSNLSSRFVSVFYGELEADGNLLFVNAGHQPPLVLSPGGGTRELSTGGMVIGPLPQASFRRGYTRLEPGDVLVACTDGILERRNPAGEFFGDEHFGAQLQTSLGRTAQEILDDVYAAALAFGEDRPWEDDATMVVARRVP
jgi:sigma-B regulation protein RsbU (phosphoserine phosphatase)